LDLRGAADVISNVLDDLPIESLSSISGRLVPKAVREAVREAPAVVQEAVENSPAAEALSE
jgi:hypothetical protein